MARPGLRRRDALHGAHRRPPRRRAERAARGAQRGGARHELQRRPAVFRRAGGPRPRADLALRLGRGLPRGGRRAHGCAARLDAPCEPRAVRGAAVRRYRPGPGARLRAARRPRLDRQEQLPDQRGAGLVAVPFGNHLHAAAGHRSAGAGPVRRLHALSGGVSDGSDRRAARGRRHPLPVVPDHRVAGRNGGRGASGGGQPRLRLRHLPGRLPVECAGRRLGRSGVATAPGPGSTPPHGSVAPAGRRAAADRQAQRDVACGRAQPAPQHRGGAGQQRLGRRGGGVGRTGGRVAGQPARRGARGVGAERLRHRLRTPGKAG